MRKAFRARKCYDSLNRGTGAGILKLISQKRARKILDRDDEWIGVVCARYGVPPAIVKAILFQEMTMMDLLDPVADAVVASNLFGKKDSSTGIGQIFGYVGLNAANFAVDNGLTTYEALGIRSDHRLDPKNAKDVRLVWKKLRRNRHANIELSTLNLASIAHEVTGGTRPDIAWDALTEDELKLILTRYNADVHYVTRYGERAYNLYRAFDSGQT